MAQDTEMLSILRELEIQHHRKKIQRGTPVRDSLRFPRLQTAVFPEGTTPDSEYVFRRRPAQPRDLKMAAAKWFMFTLFGATVLCFALQFRQDASSASKPAESPLAPANQSPVSSAQANAGRASGGPAAGATSQGLSVFANRIRAENVFDSLTDASGRKPALQNLNTVSWHEGQSVKLSILLYALLDERTEHNWREAGFFKKALVSPQPFVKNVTLTSAEQLELLRDWHVEGVLRESAQNTNAR